MIICNINTGLRRLKLINNKEHIKKVWFNHGGLFTERKWGFEP